MVERRSIEPMLRSNRQSVVAPSTASSPQSSIVQAPVSALVFLFCRLQPVDHVRHLRNKYALALGAVRFVEPVHNGVLGQHLAYQTSSQGVESEQEQWRRESAGGGERVREAESVRGGETVRGERETKETRRRGVREGKREAETNVMQDGDNLREETKERQRKSERKAKNRQEAE